MNVEKKLSPEKILLSFDNDPVLTGFKFSDGYALWIHIRYAFYRQLMSLVSNDNDNRLVVSSISRVSVRSSRYGKLRLIAQLWRRMRVFSRSTSRQYHAILFNTKVGTYLSRDSVVISKVNDCIMEAGGFSVLNVYSGFEANEKKRFPSPFFYREYFYGLAKLKAKFDYSINKKNDIETARAFITYFTKKIDGTIPKDCIKGIGIDLLAFSSIYRSLSSLYKRFLEKTSPRFIVVEDGNYGGGENALLIWQANKKNIQTIEIQHGAFDLAFRYGDRLLQDNALTEFKTKLVLTMGKYWSEFCKISSKIYELGYPYLEEKLAKLSGSDEYVLFVSQGKVTRTLFEIAKKIAPLISQQVFYRLHPSEDINDYPKLKDTNLIIVSEGDIYADMAKAEAVVGSYSTVLFEALLFKKRVYIHQNPLSDEYVPLELGTRFKDEIDLCQKIKQTTNTYDTNPEKFWAFNWRANMQSMNSKEKLW